MDAAPPEPEYGELRKHFFDPVVVHNPELPNGQQLRRQVRPPRIEQASVGFRALRARIKALQRRAAHGEIHRLLKELRQWEIRPPSLGGAQPACLRGDDENGGSSGAVVEVIDLSGDDCIDVDSYIIDVLLLKVVKSEAATALSAAPAAMHAVKAEPSPE